MKLFQGMPTAPFGLHHKSSWTLDFNVSEEANKLGKASFSFYYTTASVMRVERDV